MLLDTVDVAVVGAGPAGAAAALRVLQLRPDARVLLLDAAAFPRDKTCGDGIAAHVFDLLDALGVPACARSGPPCRACGCAAPAARSSPVAARGQPGDPPRGVRRPARRGGGGAGRRCAAIGCARCGSSPDCVVLDGRVSPPGRHRRRRRELRRPAADRRAVSAPPRSVAVAIRGYAPDHAGPDELVIEFARRPLPGLRLGVPAWRGVGANVGYGVFDRRGAGRAGSCSSACTGCCPGRSPTPRPSAATTCRSPPGRATTPTGGCCSPVTRPPGQPADRRGHLRRGGVRALAGRAALHGAGAGARAPRGDAARFRPPPQPPARARPARPARPVPRRRGGPPPATPAVFDAAVDLGLAGGTADRHALRAIARRTCAGEATAHPRPSTEGRGSPGPARTRRRACCPPAS